MINVKRRGNQILNADFEQPVPLATFADGITSDTKDKIIQIINYGSQMLDAYRHRRDNMHITNVVTMLAELEKIYHDYSMEATDTKRKHGFWAKCPGCGE